MEARPLFGPDFSARDYAVSARDRCDETYDRIRAIRTPSFKYIQNGYPLRPHLQPCAYKDNKDIYIAIREWGEAGKLSDIQHKLLLSPFRAKEELYDLKSDPWELNNLAMDEKYKKVLLQMRRDLTQWVNDTGDQGQKVEPMELYDSDMEARLRALRSAGKGQRQKEILENIALMKTWWKDGK